MHQISKELGAIPTRKSRPTKIDAINLYPFPDDILGDPVEKRFPGLQLIEGGDSLVCVPAHCNRARRVLQSIFVNDRGSP